MINADSGPFSLMLLKKGSAICLWCERHELLPLACVI